MNILHYAMTFILNEEYLDKDEDCYTDPLLETIYLREWAYWLVDLINHLVDDIENNEAFDFEDILDLDEHDIVDLCKAALLNHLSSYHAAHGRNNS